MNSKSKKEQPFNKKDYENYQKYEDAKNEYLELYHDYQKDNKAPIAISAFSKNVEELGKIRPKLIGRIRVHVDSIKKFVSIKGNEDGAIKKASQLVKLSLSQTFSGLGIEYFSLAEIDYVEKESLQKELEDYFEAAGVETWVRHEHLADLEIAYREREKLENVSIHKNALEILIKEILTQGYPEKIEEENSEDSESEEVSRGRRFHEHASKAELENYIHKIVKKAIRKESGFSKFYHHTPPHKGTPNKNQIIEHLLEKREENIKKVKGDKEKAKIKKESLIGELGRDAVKDRVYKALDGFSD